MSQNSKSNTLSMLVQNFYKGSLQFNINADDVKYMNLEWQQKFLNATFNSKLYKQYPLNNEFVKLFLKKIVMNLESSQEVHDDLYAELCKAMSDNNYEKEGFSYRHYVIGSDLQNIITIKETNNMVVNGTTGMKTWEAAFFVADWALTNHGVLANKKILELGAGVGFTGITISKMCNVHSYILTDCHFEVLNTICNNIRINFPAHIQEQRTNVSIFKDGQSVLGVMHLDWNEIEDIPTDIIPDIIIGSDIVYDPLIIKSLCSTIKNFCVLNKNLEVYIANVLRNEETFKLLLTELDTNMLLYEDINLSRSTFIQWNCNIKIFILKIRLK